LVCSTLLEESVAVTVKVNGPVAVGVPVSAPVLDKLNPGGNEPAVLVKLLWGIAANGADGAVVILPHHTGGQARRRYANR